MLDNDVTPARTQVGRRSLTRGAAWSVPVVALAMAAPANAATSGCKNTTGTLSWKTIKPVGKVQTGKTLATTLGGVTANVTTTGDTGATDNGINTTGPIGGSGSLILFHSENDNSDTSQTITITFSAQVSNVSLSLLDIDSSQDKTFFNTTNHWQDLVSVSPAPSTAAKGSTVMGSGTTGSPYRATTKNTTVPDGSATGNVDLTFAGPLKTITVVYSQDGSQDGSPKMGISDISFQACV
jgi:hypothetical protein